MAVDGYITAKEAMSLLNCTRGGLSYYVKKGQIKKTCERYGARFSESDVLRIVEIKGSGERRKRVVTEKRPKLEANSGIELQRLINQQILRNRQDGRRH